MSRPASEFLLAPVTPGGMTEGMTTHRNGRMPSEVAYSQGDRSAAVSNQRRRASIVSLTGRSCRACSYTRRPSWSGWRGSVGSSALGRHTSSVAVPRRDTPRTRLPSSAPGRRLTVTSRWCPARFRANRCDIGPRPGRVQALAGSTEATLCERQRPVTLLMVVVPHGLAKDSRSSHQIRRLVLYVHGVVPSVVGAAQVRCRIQLDRLSPA
jgi:hypothetical protein